MQVFFVESICDDPEIIAENIKVRNIFTPRWIYLKGNVCRGWDVTLSIEFQIFFFFSIPQVKFGSPDYVDRDIDEALADFIQRIECYKASYMPIDDEKDRYWPTMLFLLWD